MQIITHEKLLIVLINKKLFFDDLSNISKLNGDNWMIYSNVSTLNYWSHKNTISTSKNLSWFLFAALSSFFIRCILKT